MRIECLLAAAVVALCAALASAGAGATAYRWIDARGVVNYGDSPPRDARGLRTLDEGGGRVSTVPAPPRAALDRAGQLALELRLERIERELDALRAASVQSVVVVAPRWAMPAPGIGAVSFAAPVWVRPGWQDGTHWWHGGRWQGGWRQPAWHHPAFPGAGPWPGRLAHPGRSHRRSR